MFDTFIHANPQSNNIPEVEAHASDTAISTVTDILRRVARYCSRVISHRSAYRPTCDVISILFSITN